MNSSLHRRLCEKSWELRSSKLKLWGPIESKKVFAPPTVVHPVVATALRGGVKITACRHQAA